MSLAWEAYRAGPQHRGPDETTSAQPAESNETVLARSVFRNVERRTYEFSRRWTMEQIIGYLYSTSFPLRQLLGDRRPAFEHTLADALLERHDGDLVEQAAFQALFCTRARV